MPVIHDAFCFMFFISVHHLKEDWRLELFLLQLDERLENHRAGVHRLPGVFIQGTSAQRLAAALLGTVGVLWSAW